MSEGFDIDPLTNVFIRHDDDDDDDNMNHWADKDDTDEGGYYVGDSESPPLIPTVYEILFLLGILAIVLLCIGYCKIFCCQCKKEETKHSSSLPQTHAINIRDDDEETVTSLVSRNETIDNIIDEFSLVDAEDRRPLPPLLSKKKALRKQQEQQQYAHDIEVPFVRTASKLT
mmetsp:Transcript_49077/g.54680  ORF Transcript_49077/g.54680 Transcript_49077/m.54680 type:complete len:172 (-) Transcript_49077:244-759(-)|eukprot:CAMPEP_0171033178 /NCGR_PEP_ID=MMETSP0736-20130129/38803_1 /TAXON_ID=186038 /ORGANISM="Fragilariopsis kerguelensis, Strain L26-C5" /LENGTH=171 /DNA_ID=CAMNT_0011476015 /DNA_START=82 /DNA_END=597 /DNA_ORIENTATION=-